MKTKNVILGLLAIVFALGSAFTSYSLDDLVPTTYYVKATSNGTSYTCEPVTVDPAICDLMGTATCRIAIQLANPPGGSKAVNAHPDSPGCVNTLVDNNPNNGGPHRLDTFDPIDVIN